MTKEKIKLIIAVALGFIAVIVLFVQCGEHGFYSMFRSTASEIKQYVAPAPTPTINLTPPSTPTPDVEQEECQKAYFAAERSFLVGDFMHRDGRQPDGTYEFVVTLGEPKDITPMLVELLVKYPERTVMISGLDEEHVLVEPVILYMLAVVKAANRETLDEGLKYLQLLYDKYKDIELIIPVSSDRRNKRVKAGVEAMLRMIAFLKEHPEGERIEQLKQAIALFANDFGDDDWECSEDGCYKYWQSAFGEYYNLLKKQFGPLVDVEDYDTPLKLSPEIMGEIEGEISRMGKLVKHAGFSAELNYRLAGLYSAIRGKDGLAGAMRTYGSILENYAEIRRPDYYWPGGQGEYGKIALNSILNLEIRYNSSSRKDFLAMCARLDGKYAKNSLISASGNVREYIYNYTKDITADSYLSENLQMIEGRGDVLYAAIDTPFSGYDDDLNIIKIGSSGKMEWSRILNAGSISPWGRPPFGLVKAKEKGVILFCDVRGYEAVYVDNKGTVLGAKKIELQGRRDFYGFADDGAGVLCVDGSYSGGKARKYDKDMNLMWEFDVGAATGHPPCGCYAVDGGYIVTGGKNGAFALKLSGDGVLLWKKVFKYGNFVNRTLAIVMTDNDLIFYGSDMGGAVIARLDKDGNIIWEKNHEMWAAAMVETAGGGIMAVSGKPALSKYDRMGKQIWAKEFSDEEKGFSVFLNNIIRTSDGNFMVGGGVSKDNVQVPGYLFFAKVDADGREIWRNLYNRTEFLGVEEK